MLTSAKLSVGYLVVEITRELDKEPSLHCSSIYINTMWSMLQQCVYLMSYYSSTILLPQGHHAISMYPDVILFNLHHHACTICIPWGTHVPWHHVRRGSHQGGSPQNGLGDERTCGTTLASAYVLRRLSAAWSQLQMKKGKSEWKWVLNGVSPLNTGDRVQ